MNKFYSLSEHPGSFGKFFYNYFFEKYQINSNYQPLGTNAKDFSIVFKELIDNDAKGISISMPFKSYVINYLDELDDAVVSYKSCNTVKIFDKKTVGYNTDLKGIEYISKLLKNTDTISILGLGCIGSMFTKYLNSHTVTCYSRHLNNFSMRHNDCDVIINCTALGTINKLSPLDYIPQSTSLVIDLAIKENDLKNMCSIANINYISGLEFYKNQFIKQFEIYTGICLSNEELDLAEKVFKNDR